MNRFDRVLQSTVDQLHLNHIAPRRLHRLLNRDWDLARFTTAITHATLAISDNRQRCEAHDAATFDGLGHAVDLHQFLLEVALSALVALLLLVIHCHA